MFALVTSKLEFLTNAIHKQKIISHSGFLLPLVQLVSYGWTLTSKDFNVTRTAALISLLSVLVKKVPTLPNS